MGEEIDQAGFEPSDYDRFRDRLEAETAHLLNLLAERRLDQHARRLGYELELCLADANGEPAPCNIELLDHANNPRLTTELARFNLEINGSAFDIGDQVFSQLEADLQQQFDSVCEASRHLGCRVGLFGVFPSVMLEHLEVSQYMTPLNRYAELNRMLLKMRQRPIHLRLEGEDTLSIDKDDVMLEALGTSLQVHLQLPLSDMVPAYHAALWATMLMLGVAPNSPLVLGRRCWPESRVGIFRQAVDTRNVQEHIEGIEPRVHLGKRWINGFDELFTDNLMYQPILPQHFDEPVSALKHLSMHNGTLWRWVRPIIGHEADGTPTLRLELRVVAAGPTVLDTLANLVLHVGLVEALRQEPERLTAIPFESLYNDFNRVAREGPETEIQWLDGRRIGVRQLLSTELIPSARTALQEQGYGDSARWLDVAQARSDSGQTGAAWMMAHWNLHRDGARLVREYLDAADTAQPVHTWARPS